MLVDFRYMISHQCLIFVNHEIVYQDSLPIFILNLFQIPIFEKGYEKDPAIVAKEAIQEASRNGSDVVLVDTAGRMQVCIFSYYPKLK